MYAAAQLSKYYILNTKTKAMKETAQITVVSSSVMSMAGNQHTSYLEMLEIWL